MIEEAEPHPFTPSELPAPPLRVIVCGGRDFNDRELLYAALDRFHAHQQFGIVWHGNARGADTLADEWCRARGVKVFPVPAEWAKHGKRAGPLRNQKMLGQGIGLVVAFAGGAGTADMVGRARKAGVMVMHPRRTFSASGARQTDASELADRLTKQTTGAEPVAAATPKGESEQKDQS